MPNYVWIDHDLSQQVRHQGTIEWGVSTAPELSAVGVKCLTPLPVVFLAELCILGIHIP
jgi:hypothetical protein